MTKQQAQIAAVVLDYLPMASPEMAAEISEKIVETLQDEDHQKKEVSDSTQTSDSSTH